MTEFAPLQRRPAGSESVARPGPTPGDVARLDEPALERSASNSTTVAREDAVGPRLDTATTTKADGRFPVQLGSGRPLSERHLGPVARHAAGRDLDLSAIRIHHDGAAARLADAHGANAVTVGNDIAFAPGQYRPGTPDGDKLLAHEIGHAAQQAEAGTEVIQRDGPQGRGIGRTPPEGDYEVETGGEAGTEDFAFTFGHDSASVEDGWAGRISTEIQGADGPVTVEVHGYASDQGDVNYNVNLSAHRAMAVGRLLRQLLPEGSTIRVIAHGTTTAFGDNAAANRRVGVDLIDQAPANPLTLRVPPWSWNFRLRRPSLSLLDPSGASGAGAGAGAGAGTTETGEAVPVVPPILFPPDLAGVPPWLQIDPVPPDQRAALRLGLDPSLMHLTARRRGATLTLGDEAMIRWHYTTYYGLARVLWDLGGRIAFDSPEELANTLTSKAVDFSLAGDNPTLVEVLDAEDARLRQLLNLPPATTFTIPVFTREF